MERVLVGVDGSDAAKDALRWAMEEARCRDAILNVTLVAEHPELSGMPFPTQRGDTLEKAKSQLAAVIDEVVGTDPDLEIESQVRTGDPRQVLRDLSEDTDLLVVGSRGHGGLTGLLLGSVGQYLVTHASCPVTVVRGRSR